MKKLTLLIIALSLPTLGLAASDPLEGLRVEQSPYEACKDVSLLSSDVYNKDKDYWDAAISQCGIDIQVIPNSGFLKSFITTVGQGEQGKEKSISFLTAVGQKAAQYTRDNLKINEVFINCAKGNQAWFTEMAQKDPKNAESLYDFGKCESLLASVKEIVKQNGPKLRLEREIMKKNRSRWEGFKNFMVNVGETVGLNMKAPADRVPAEGAILKQAEEIHNAEAKVIEDAFQEEIAKHMAKVEENKKKLGANADALAFRHERMDGTPTWFHGWYQETNRGENPNAKPANPYKDSVTVNKIRDNHLKHTEKYMQIVQETPILAFLSTDNPTNKDLADAGEAIAENAKKEIEKIQQTVAAIQDGTKYIVDEVGVKRPIGKMSEADKSKLMLDFVRYGAVIREMLKENPGYCGPATGLVNYLANADLRKYSYLVPAMLVGGTVGLVGRGMAAAGIAISTVATDALVAGAFAVPLVPIYANEYQKYQSLKQKTFSLVDTSNEYNIDGRLTKGMNVAEIKEFQEARDQWALTLALMPADALGFGLYKGTAKLVTNRLFQMRALTKGLKAHGLSDAEVKALRQQLASDNPNIAVSAWRRGMNILGIRQDEVNFLQKAVAKKLITQEDQKALQEMVDALRKVPGKERTEFMGRFGTLLDELNTAKVNVENRGQIIDLFSNASKVGISDPKKVAAIATDWDEGLDGLSRVFELAAKRMDDPSIRTIASVSERQQQAFKTALYDSLPEDMPVAQRNKLVGEMCTCPGMCPAK